MAHSSKTLLAVLVAITFPAIAFAENVEVNIPGEGWRISFDSPPLSQKQEARRGSDYAFKASSDRFNISLFVEQPQGKGDTHKDCYRFYWPKASGNPMIAKDTVVTSDATKYFRVQYDIIAEIQSQPIRQRNVHYYVAHRGRWVDVHISIIEPTQEDGRIFVAFDTSLSYGP